MELDPKKTPIITATIKRITASSNGGWVLAFDVPDTDSNQVTKLADLRQKVLTLCILDAELDK